MFAVTVKLEDVAACNDLPCLSVAEPTSILLTIGERDQSTDIEFTEYSRQPIRWNGALSRLRAAVVGRRK